VNKILVSEEFLTSVAQTDRCAQEQWTSIFNRETGQKKAHLMLQYICMQSLFKQLFVQLLILGLLVGLFYVLFWNKKANIKPLSMDCREVEISGKTFILKRAFTPEARELGLSGTISLPDNSGMIFEFEIPGKYGFWMKDMLMPIDIIFVDQITITDVYKTVTPESFPTSFLPSRDINFVIELNGGTSEKIKIEIGEEIKISAPKSC